jgi:predicted RNA-binding protein YlqC (UPF0109 family)
LLTATGVGCYYAAKVVCGSFPTAKSGGQFLNALVKGKSMTQNAIVEVEELVREIARALVDEPEAVEVESVGREETTVLKLRVAPTDVGKVIGKQGRTARSVRTILGAVSMKVHHRYTLDILEEDEP